MTNRQARSSARETSVGDKRALFAKVHRFNVRRRVEHLLHSRAAFGAFVRDYNAVAALDLAAENSFAGVFLRIEHNSGSFEVPQRLINACRFHNAAVFGNVAEQHGQAAVFRVGVLNIANAAVGAVGVKRIPNG